MVTTGELQYYRELKAELPPGIFDLLKIPGLGPKKVRVLYDALGIESIGELEYACKENRLINLPGFGKKTQDNILKGIAHIRSHEGLFLIHEAESMALPLLKDLQHCPDIKEVSVAGSLRRRKEVIKDIDLLASSIQEKKVMDYFVSLPQVTDIIGKGATKASIRIRGGIAVDMRVVSPEQYPYALHHFTGSKEHNTKMRHIAKSMGFKMNEYGLFQEDGKLISCKDEEELFNRLGMAYIPPELREDMGEIETALENRLPNLVEAEDLKGLFHFHSRYSDGSNSIRELAEEVRREGYSYMGISDHSRSAYYAGGLKEEDILRQIEEVDALNHIFSNFYIFKGIESDILPDGSLDYEDVILKLLDFVIISVHSQFRMDRESMTARIIKAMDNPYVTILGHPTGRLLLSRDEYEADMEQILEKAAEKGIILEINANPHRLDLDWRWIKKAREMGIRFMINPDAHNLSQIAYTSFGIAMARKDWCTREDIVNCMDADSMAEFLKNNLHN